MSVAGWILFGFGVLRLTVALVNYLSRPYLRPEDGRQAGECRVSVLVPARNEQENITALLNNYKTWRGEVHELIVYDDLSSDGTFDTVNRYAEDDGKIKLIKGVELPPGWLGKNHACDKLARHATGDILLFIDADVTLVAGTVNAAAGYFSRTGVELLSIFPTQVIDNTGALMAVPLMNWILLGLLPLPAVRLAPYPSLAAANGQFMLFGKKRYDALRPHSRLRAEPVEDIAIIKFYKREGLEVSTLLGGRNVFCRMYGGLADSIEGFSKNLFDFFGGSPWVCWLFIAATTVAPLWIFIFNGAVAGTVYLAVIILIRIFVSAASRQNILLNILLTVPQQVVLWIIGINAAIKKKNKQLQWKGRHIF